MSDGGTRGEGSSGRLEEPVQASRGRVGKSARENREVMGSEIK